MNPLPTNNYLDFTQYQLGNEENNLDFWRDWYAKFNPSAPAVQSADAQPGYTQAAQAGTGLAQSMSGLGLPGGSGNLDIGALSRALNQKANVLGQGTNLSNQEQDFNTNARTQEGAGASSIGRSNEEQQLGTLAGYKLPMSQTGNNMHLEDFLNGLTNQYNASQEDPLQTLSGPLGSLLGPDFLDLIRKDQKSQGGGY